MSDNRQPRQLEIDDEVRAALLAARAAIHELCLERGSTDGYGVIFATINRALTNAR